MLQIMLTLTAFMVLVIPMGHYLYHIAVGQKTFADPVFDPVDRLIYKLCGLKGEDMGWKIYGLSLLMANAVIVLIWCGSRPGGWFQRLFWWVCSW